MRATAVSLVLAAGCASAPVASAPPGTVARARENFSADVTSCQRVRSSRLSTLGPTIFQPISGDEPFNDCVTRAKSHLDLAMLELQ